MDEKNRHARVCAAAALARPVASRTHRPSAPPRSGKFAADRPRSSGPGCSFPHFSQRRTVSRGVCICSSASRSRRRFPTERRPLRSRPRLACKQVAHRPYHCGTLRPTDRDFHSAGGVLRHADARDVHRATAPFGTQTPAAGFAPPTRHARPLIFSPHATYRRLISSYKFLLSPSLFPVAAPIGPPLRAVGHRPAGTGAVCSSFLSAPRRRDSNGPFFHLQVLPVLAAPPASPSGIRPRGAAPSAARRPFPHDLRRAVPGIPTVRRCPHPFTPFIPPIARAPRL